jgi:hypothetical protein
LKFGRNRAKVSAALDGLFMALPPLKDVTLYVDNRGTGGPTHPRHHHEGRIIKKGKV